MTITLNFTSIFAWIGGIVCMLVSLWILGWVIYGIRGYGELLGIWSSMGRGMRNLAQGIKAGVAWLVARITP